MKLKFEKDFDSFLNALDTPAPISIRLNPGKNSGRFSEAEKIPWSENGRYLSTRPSFTLDPLFHAGCYYVQEASSQFLEQAFLQTIKGKENPIVLDLCAAPGGKSTHLLSLLDGKGVLISNEIIQTRNNILRENIAKWGLGNSVVTQNESSVFGELKNVFDVIVVDAPCSGEGLFRRDPEAAAEWSEEAVHACSIRQQNILHNIIPAIKPGGYIIYSTCTFESSENEKQIQFLLKNDFEKIELSHLFPRIEQSEYGYSFYPHKIRGEGFFISVLQKKQGDVINIPMFKSKSKSASVAPGNLSKFVDLEKVEVYSRDNRFWLYVPAVFEFMKKYSEKLYVRNAGIFAGEMNKGELIPSHELALYTELLDHIPSVEVNEADALSFLRGETTFKTTAATGWSIIKHEGFNLGWIKSMPNRFNNYYPKEWRIRMR